MGEYNPTEPQILGQEWVPIRDEALFFSPAVNVVEVGHQFTLETSRTISDCRFTLNTLPSANTWAQVMQIAVYPAGTEADVGPIQSVIIPCNNGGVTGNGSLGVYTMAQAMLDPGDSRSLSLLGGVSTDVYADLYFATNSYAQQLAGKRILKVELLYVAESSSLPTFQCYALVNQIGATAAVIYASTPDGTIVAPEAGPGFPVYQSINMGEVTCFWTTSPTSTTERMPWTYETLMRFERTSSNRLAFRFDCYDNTTGSLTIRYAALRVTYCEERRALISGGAFGRGGDTDVFGQATNYVLGANTLTARTMGTFAANPVLTAGDYTVVVSAPDTGVPDVTNSPYPILNACRELYQIPPHPGIQVNLSQEVGETFTSEETHILPQLSLHTSGGPLTEVHVYGRQAVAQVYGSITATQDIDDGVAGAAYNYPWVRFYARRWGDTTVDLTLDSPSIPGSSVTITPTEHDALDEIIDGWKEVTLYFDTPPSMGTGTRPQWRWSASGESAGNRWEILGATAPALSGVPGNLMNLVPSPNQLSVATYGQPASGAAVNLAWIPQYAPAVTATADDQTSDAVILFAQELPAITGLSVTEATQEVVGIGLDCGLDPCCIPTGIMYNAITWSTITVDPTSAFGYYEIQRMDTVDTTWATVMKGTSITGASFNDYEARVGLENSYRIRAVDSYEFPGAWSDTVTITPTAPGITGGCVADGHVLIFTSNERQDGDINLAYASVWEGRVAEDFEFPESNFVQLQAMYDRDFFTAFRPTERGGEQFTRTVLVQAAAISAPTLGDFRSLRDMAWDSTSYICVRDEDGNRWFATVLVPGGRVTFNRRLYMAEVRVIEVTDTPSPADPWS